MKIGSDNAERRPRRFVAGGLVARIVTSFFVAASAMGSGRIDLDESYMQAHLTTNGELYVTYKLGYDTSASATTVDSRDFDFNISYGIVGSSNTCTATMSSSGTLLPAGAGIDYKVWYVAGDGGTVPGYTSPAIPGLQGDDEVWYQVCVSNTAHNGSAPAATNDLTTTLAVHYAYASYRDVGCVFSQTPWQYNVSGAATPGMGYVSARLTYAHNTSSLGSDASTMTTAIGAGGAFSFGIPAVGNGANAMTMTWKVELLDGNNVAILCNDYLGTSIHTEKTVDASRVTYTWTGNGDGRSWADGNNWTQSVASCLGYPGVKNTYYWNQIVFNTDADVDLGGQTYGVRDGGGNLVFGANINVTLRNGLLDLNNGTYTLGASGTTLTFDRFSFVRGTVSDGSYTTVDFAAGTTANFVGSSTSDMNWKPTQNNVNFTFQDGTIKTRYSTSSTIYGQSGSRTLITNAVWQTTAGDVSKGTAYITTFLDGPDRQAQFVCNAGIDLRRYYVVRIPAGGHSDATIKAATLMDDTNVGTFIVYVDDYLDDAPVPLVKFTTSNSTYKGNNDTRMATQLNNGKIQLFVRTGDVATPTDSTSFTDVTAERNARLEWDSETQTLYYRQDCMLPSEEVAVSQTIGAHGFCIVSNGNLQVSGVAAPVTIVADPGYVIAQVVTNGAPVAGLLGETFVTLPVVFSASEGADNSIVATFAKADAWFVEPFVRTKSVSLGICDNTYLASLSPDEGFMFIGNSPGAVGTAGAEILNVAGFIAGLDPAYAPTAKAISSQVSGALRGGAASTELRLGIAGTLTANENWVIPFDGSAPYRVTHSIGAALDALDFGSNSSHLYAGAYTSGYRTKVYKLSFGNGLSQGDSLSVDAIYDVAAAGISRVRAISVETIGGKEFAYVAGGDDSFQGVAVIDTTSNIVSRLLDISLSGSSNQPMSIDIAGIADGTPRMYIGFMGGDMKVFALTDDGFGAISTEPVATIPASVIGDASTANLFTLDGETNAVACANFRGSTRAYVLEKKPASLIVRGTFDGGETVDDRAIPFGAPANVTFAAPSGQTITDVTVNGVEQQVAEDASDFTYEAAALTNYVYVAMTASAPAPIDPTIDPSLMGDLYVSAATGSDANSGRSWVRAKASIQAAIDVAEGGETILVAPGTYEPIATADLPLCIVGVGGASNTVIDASLAFNPGVTNRCATLGTTTNTLLRGFALVNGAAPMGGGSYYGVLEDCIITNCTATNGSGGGAYYSDLVRCTIVGNSASGSGGGIFNSKVEWCRVVGNTAGSNGGGVCNMVSKRIVHSLISGNYARIGGGIFLTGTSPIIQCTIADNRASGQGGGLFIGSVGLIMANCTITANRASSGSGVYFTVAGRLYNTILWGNTSLDGMSEDNWALNSSASPTFYYSCTTPLSTSGPRSIAQDPLLCRFPDGTYRLAAGSPCINAGNSTYANTYVFQGNPNRLDMLGNARIQGACVDMGAIEGGVDGFVVSTRCEGCGNISDAFLCQPGEVAFIEVSARDAIHPLASITVDGEDWTDRAVVSNGIYRIAFEPQGDAVVVAHFSPAVLHVSLWGDDTSDGLTWATAKRTIQAAVDSSAANDVIRATNGVYSAFSVAPHSHSLTIESIEGCGETSIDGGGAARCATLGTNGKWTGTTLRGFTLRNGKGTNGAGAFGGTLIDCVITNCQASSSGGGTYYADLERCVIANNGASTYGGGSYYGTLRNCLVTGNNASSNGGGTYSSKLYNCTVSGNTTTDASASSRGAYGGTAYNSIVFGNEGVAAVEAYNMTLNFSCVDIDPQFMTVHGRDWCLAPSSPCVDAGTNAFVIGETDLAGNPRIQNGTVDMGCYENAPQSDVPLDSISVAEGIYTYSGTAWTPEVTVRSAIGTLREGAHYTLAWTNNVDAGTATVVATGVAPAFAGSVTNTFAIVPRALSESMFSLEPFYPFTGEEIRPVLTVVEPTLTSNDWEIVAFTNNIAPGTAAVIIAGKRNFTGTATLPFDIACMELFVSATGDDSAYGATADTPKRTLQAAVDAAYAGAVVYVSEGVYAPVSTGGKAIRVIATAGSAKTVIDGGGTNRCVTAGTGYDTVFVGFTIRNGNQATGGASNAGGGGVFYGEYQNCVIENCRTHISSYGYGGGAFRAKLVNCLIKGNIANAGGGTRDCTLVNCTVVGNRAMNWGGGGVDGGTILNSIVWGNYVNNSSYSATYNHNGGTFSYSCTSPSMSGAGNVSDDPRFVDSDNGDYRLLNHSPCLDAGSTAYDAGATDLAGNPRVAGSAPDMGCYEGAVELPVPEAPQGFSAEDGRRIGFVRLAWAEADWAWTYAVERASGASFADAHEIGTTTALFFDDTNAVPDEVYWYRIRGVNPEGRGEPSAADSGFCLGPLAISAPTLGTATARVPIEAVFSATGGAGGYVWRTGADDYTVSRTPSSWIASEGQSTGVSGDDACRVWPLPFDFPFYGSSYDKVWVNSNGELSFDGEWTSFAGTESALKSRKAIAVFWKDLRTGGAGVTVTANGAESISFHWQNCTYFSGGGAVNASVTLFADGTIVCSYGGGNASGAFVGVSAGDNSRIRCLALSGTSMANADDVVFTPQDLPAGLTLASDGTLSGTPEAAGTYTFTLFVTDANGNGQSRLVTLEVEENPNVRIVTFDLGGQGARVGGGALVQGVLLGGDATAPAVRATSGWVFNGWDRDFTNIVGDLTVNATWRPARPAIRIVSAETAAAADAGDAVEVSWTLENWGNAEFSGTMAEEVRLVSVSNPTVTNAMASVTFADRLARDGTVSRTAAFTLPRKGMEGRWRVLVVSALRPSIPLHDTAVSAMAAGTLEVSAIPLPMLVVENWSLPSGSIMPGDMISVSWTTANRGAAEATAPWLESLFMATSDGTTLRLASVATNATLAAGESATRVLVAQIPELIAKAGEVSFFVRVDEDDAVVEQSDDHSAAEAAMRADSVASLGRRLYLTAAASSVRENGGGVRFTAKRSGLTTDALALDLSSEGATSDIRLPTSVSFPRGSTSTAFTVNPVDNSVVDGTRTVTVTVSADGFASGGCSLQITDNETPHLYVTLSGERVREGEALSGVVTRELAADQPLTVYLAGPATSRCSYPSSVTIGAGERTAAFELAIPDNDVAQQELSYTLRVSASGHSNATAAFTVEDDDVPGVVLELYPEIASESAGANAVYATLTRADLTDKIDQAIRIRLSHTPPGNLILPSEITIPKYTAAVRFAVGTVDNARDDGDRDVTIDGAVVIESCGCSGQPSSGDAIRAVMTVIDDDGPALSLKAEPATMKEGLEEAGYLILSHNSVLADDLDVSLFIDTEGEIGIPATATIPAGATSVRIPVRTLDDGVEDGAKLVSVYAEDDNGVFAPASTWVQVSDQNLPDLSVSLVAAPSGVVAMERFSVVFTVTNSGFMARSGAIPYAVHLVRGANNATVSASTLQVAGSLAGGIAVDGTLSGEVALTAPEMPGDCRVAVVIDPDGTISELDSANNTGWSAVVGVSAAYTAEVSADADAYLPGETITMTGRAMLAGGAAASNVRVDVYLLRDSYRKTLSATTAADGSFTVTYTPSSGECGHYRIGACYPGVGSSSVQDEFDVMGMKRTSNSNVIWDYALGDVATRTVTLKNLSAAPLTGLTARFDGIPADCSLEYTLPETIPRNGSVTLSMTATAIGVTEQTDYENFRVYLTTDQGVALDFALYFHSQTQKAYLRSTPTSINTTMAVGHERYVDVTIVNDGKGDSGRVTATVPNARWLKVVAGATAENLASGESMTVTLLLCPEVSDGLVLNNPLSGGRLAVNCVNGTGCSVSLKFTPVSNATGSIVVDATDNNTYTLESAPHLEGAYVRVSNPYTGATVASGYTGADGLWTADNIPEGRYQLTVTADKHDTFADELIVEPGTAARAAAFLQYKLVTATWEVVKTEIEDEYEITLLLDYETQVPAPVVQATMPAELPVLNEGESFVYTITVNNTGLIAAEEVWITLPEIPGYSFSIEDNGFRLSAKSSRDVLVVFTRLVSGTPVEDDDPSNPGSGSGGTGSQGTGGGSGSGTGSPSGGSHTSNNVCTYRVQVAWYYWCGRNYPVYRYYSTIKHGECPAEVVMSSIPDNWVYVPSGSSGTATRSSGSGGTGGNGNLRGGTGSTWRSVNCDAELTDFLNGVRFPWERLAEILGKGGRDMLLGQIPFMSCVDLAVNGLETIWDNNFITEWLNDRGPRINGHALMEDHFKGYDERLNAANGWIDAGIDFASCGIDVANAFTGEAATPVAGGVKGWLQGLRQYEDALGFISNVKQLSDLGIEAYFDVVLPYQLDLRYSESMLRPHHPQVPTGLIHDVVVFEGMLRSQSVIVESMGGSWDDLTYSQSMSLMHTGLRYAKMSSDLLVSPGDLASAVSGVVDASYANEWASRWNAGITAFLNGTDVPEGAIDILDLLENAWRLRLGLEYVRGRGYSDLYALAISIAEQTQALINDTSDSVCASITLRLSQTLAMTREAFDGTLTMFNGNTTTPITALKLDISVLDEDGNECKDLFEVFANGTSGEMSEGDILVGGLSVPANGTGSAMVRFIPERGAAPTDDKLYRFGGTVTYIDPFSGERATVKLTPVSLTVSPSPYLHLDYFVQRDVYADDPFTPDVVEASMPAELAVLVRNNGGGEARNVTISSVQPETVQNEKGLVAAFRLSDYSLDATALNGSTAHLGLSKVALGNIAPGAATVAQWWLTSSIEGHFTGMAATVTPLNSWNTPDTALVDSSVGVHKLVRSVVADNDALPDFLVCDDDLYGRPNEIWMSAGPVLDVSAASATSTALPNGAEVTLSVTLTPTKSGWNYGSAVVPGLFRYSVARVTRSDGSEVPLRNAWITDRTFRDGNTPLLEERIHLVDDFSSNNATSYAVTLSAKPTDGPEIVAFEGVSDGAVESSPRNTVSVVFSAVIDPATFTVGDLALIRQGAFVSDLTSLAIAAADGTGTRFTISGLSALCSTPGRYELTVQCAGIANQSGSLGTAGRSVAWTYSAAEAPYIIGVDGVPVRRVQSLDTVTVVLSAAIDPSTFTRNALRLNGAAVGDGVTIRVADATGARFEIAGLAATQEDDGAYALSIDATSLTSAEGTAGVESFTATWTRDTTAPRLVSLERESDLNGTRFVVAFSEDVAEGDVTVDRFELARLRTRGNATLPDSAVVTALGGGRYAISGVDSALLADGDYRLTFTADGIADEAGNAAEGTASLSWTQDATPPSPVANLRISPDLGTSDSDGVTSEAAVTLLGTLPDDAATVAILVRYAADSGSGTVLVPAFAPEGTALSANITLPSSGNQTLVVRCADAAGNESETTLQVYLDAIALTAALSGAPTDGADVAESITLTFSDAVVAADVTAGRISLTRDGTGVLLTGVELTPVANAALPAGTATSFVISSLDAVCDSDGAYALAFDGTGVRKALSGRTMDAGNATVAASWTRYAPDIEAPRVLSVRIDGAERSSTFVDSVSSIEVTFSEPVNIPGLVTSGWIGQSVKLVHIGANGKSDSVVFALGNEVSWDEESTTMRWTPAQGSIGLGDWRLSLDAGFIADAAGNALAADGADSTVRGLVRFAEEAPTTVRVTSYAMPSFGDFNRDGAIDLLVGEKSADGRGRVQLFLNAGITASGTPAVTAAGTLAAGGEEIALAAQGCQGASVALLPHPGTGGAADLLVGDAFGNVRFYPALVEAENGGDAQSANGAATPAWGEGRLLYSGDGEEFGSLRAVVSACDLLGSGQTYLVIGGMDGRFRRCVGRLHRVLSSGGTPPRLTWVADDNGEPIAVAAGRSAPAAFDLNGDGLPDLVSGDTAGAVWAFLADERNSWRNEPILLLEAGSYPDRSRVAIADFTGGGIPTLAVGRSDGSVRLHSGTDSPSPAFLFSVSRTPPTLAVALDATDFAWTTGGVAEWTGAWTDSAAKGGHAAFGGTALDEGETSWLETSFEGGGLFSFKWRLDGTTPFSGTLAVSIDGAAAVTASADALSNWVTVYHGLASGSHTVRWTWTQGAVPGEMAWLDAVSWIPAPWANTSSQPVIDALAEFHASLVDMAAIDENASESEFNAVALSDADGDGLTAWDEFVAGTDPGNPDSVLIAMIDFDAAGHPVITWTPDLNEGGTKSLRKYTVDGKANLSDEWGPPDDESRFFRVRVDLPDPPPPVAPSAPVGVSATQGASVETTTVLWSAVATATSYEVWRGTDDDRTGATRIASGLGVASFSDATGEPGALYWYWVRAIGAGGVEGAWSDAATGYRAFAAPGNASAASTPDGVVLTWTGTSGNYIVYRGVAEDGSDARSIASVTTETYTYNLSSVGVSFHFWVAQCAPGKLRPGEWSYCGSGYKIFPAPANVAATQGTSTDAATVSWETVTSAAWYEVWRGTSGDVSSATRIGSQVQALSFADATAAEGVVYTYWVRAVSTGNIAGAWSDPVTGYRAFAAPGNASAVSTPDGVVLTWTGTSGNYIVYRGVAEDGSDARSIASVTTETYTYNLSSVGVSFHFWVAQCAPGKLRPGEWAYCGFGCKTNPQ